MSRHEIRITTSPLSRVERIWYRRLGETPPLSTGSNGPWHANWIRLLPYSWRWLHAIYAGWFGYYWLHIPARCATAPTAATKAAPASQTRPGHRTAASRSARSAPSGGTGVAPMADRLITPEAAAAYVAERCPNPLDVTQLGSPEREYMCGCRECPTPDPTPEQFRRQVEEAAWRQASDVERDHRWIGTEAIRG